MKEKHHPSRVLMSVLCSPPSSSREVLGCGVVEEQEVHSIQVEQFLLVERTDVLKVACCHVAISPGALTRCWKLKRSLHSSQPEHSLSVWLQSLVLPHYIIVDEARVAEGVHPLPVLIQRLLPLGPRVHEVLDELRERNVIPFLQRFGLRVGPVPADDLGSVAFVESRVVAAGELVPVGGH